MLTFHRNRIRYTAGVAGDDDDSLLPLNDDVVLPLSGETGDTDANEESNGATAASSSSLSGFASFLFLSVVAYAGMLNGPV